MDFLDGVVGNLDDVAFVNKAIDLVSDQVSGLVTNSIQHCSNVFTIGVIAELIKEKTDKQPFQLVFLTAEFLNLNKKKWR